MIYNVHYDVSAMIVSLLSIIFVITKKGMYRRQNKILFSILIVGLLAAFFDITSSIGNSYVVNWSYGVRDFHNYCYLLLHNTMPCMIFCYIFTLTGGDFQSSKKKWKSALVFVPLIVMLCLLFSNIFTRKIFFYDENRVYTHGSMFYILFGIAYFYIILCFFQLIRYGKYVSFARKAMLYMFFISSSISIGAQIIFPHILLQLFVESCCSLGLVITVDNDDEARDSISTCYNRNTFIYNFNIYSHNESGLKLMLINMYDMNSMVRTVGIQAANELKRAFGSYLKTVSEHLEYYYLENEYYALIYKSDVDTDKIVREIAQRMDEGWKIQDMHLQCHGSIVTLEYPGQIHSLEELLTIISFAGGEGNNGVEKKSGREKPSAENTLENLRKESRLEEVVKKAIRFEELKVFYQPVWNSRQNKITSGEALVRLPEAVEEALEAWDIVKIAEKKGFIKELFEYVLRKVCLFVEEGALQKSRVEYISINLSGVQFWDRNLAGQIGAIVDEYRIPHSAIAFEIESITSAGGYERAFPILEQLRSMGFSIIADSFGESTISNMDICNFNFDQVKFSRKLLDSLSGNLKVNTFLNYCVRMFAGMGIDGCMVGVENEGDKNLLQNMGFGLIQGYYFSEALPANEFLRYAAGFNEGTAALN